ncbi:4-hydroxybenzoate transporter, partial [Burkholderia multivorans]
LLAARMLPAIGWQGIFVVGGGVPLAMLGAVALLLPESLCYLASRDDTRAQQRVRATLSKIATQPLPADARFTVPDEASAK